ncbi:helix-turn-helix domain-containing protein [Candidatus Peregrinibacteria bacterium]|nr:helix-turn-helix domain-containing protein [Candidatus Peregrinibacteria bacterium]
MNGKILTSQDVASLLQIHQFTVLKYIREGKLKAIKIGRVYRVREIDIDDFLESQSTI